MKRIKYLVFVLFILNSCGTKNESEEVLSSLIEKNIELSLEMSNELMWAIEKAYHENTVKVEQYFNSSKKVNEVCNDFLEIANGYQTGGVVISIDELKGIYQSSKDSLIKILSLYRDSTNSFESLNINEIKSWEVHLMKLEIAQMKYLILRQIFSYVDVSGRWLVPYKIIILDSSIEGNQYSFKLESEAFQCHIDRYIAVDSVVFNNQTIESPFDINPIFAFSIIEADSLNSGIYEVFGTVTVFGKWNAKRSEEFYHKFKIE